MNTRPMPAPAPQAPAPQGQPGQPMPQGQAPQGKPVEADNPVVEAFKTIGMWVAAQAENGNPKATAMQEALRNLISVMMDKGMAPGAPMAPNAPKPAPRPMGPQQAAPQGARPQGPMPAPQGGHPNANVRPIPVM